MKKNRQARLATRDLRPPLRTLIVDDSEVLLTCLCEFLDQYPAIHVVGTAADGYEALQRAELFSPDLVLMDLRMPGMDGLQATALLRQRLPKTRIIIMTLEVSARAAAQAHGAHGFVEKVQLTRTLMPEIQRVFLSASDAAEGGL